MITDDKVIDIFFIIGEFCKEFEQEMSKQPVLGSDGVRRRNRKANMSHSEIMTIEKNGGDCYSKTEQTVTVFKLVKEGNAPGVALPPLFLLRTALCLTGEE